VDGSIAAPSRAAIVAEAQSWLGTPYRHQASGAEPETPPPYTPDWAELRGCETLRDAARRHLVETKIVEAAPGDVLLFRISAAAPMKHAAILSARERIIHAYWGRAVVESRMTPFWQSRLAAAFSFPGVAPWRN
jgi:NlpC/P60 family putative phage cell wall peptidase